MLPPDTFRLPTLITAISIVLTTALPAFGQERIQWPAERWPLDYPLAPWPSVQTSEKPRVNQPAMPDADNMLILIRTSLLTLNDAIQTGNFTVLRDRLAPSVRNKNSTHTFHRIFGRLIEQKMDLRAAAVVTPEITAVPDIDQNGRLTLKGVFRAPDRTGVQFQLVFERAEDEWRLYGASIDMVPAADIVGTAQRRTTENAVTRSADNSVPTESQNRARAAVRQ